MIKVSPNTANYSVMQKIQPDKQLLPISSDTVTFSGYKKKNWLRETLITLAWAGSSLVLLPASMTVAGGMEKDTTKYLAQHPVEGTYITQLSPEMKEAIQQDEVAQLYLPVGIISGFEWFKKIEPRVFINKKTKSVEASFGGVYDPDL